MTHFTKSYKKKKIYGHAVSHAKNRTARIFKPNNQKLKVWLNGKLVRVTFSASWIQRLKKSGKLGPYTLWKFGKTEVKKTIAVPERVSETPKAKEAVKTVLKDVKPKTKAKVKVPALDISSIVGKKA